MKSKWWVPLSGVVGIGLIFAAFPLMGSPPEANKASGQEIAKYLHAHAHDMKTAILILSAALLLLLIFTSYVKTRLDDAEGECGTASRLSFAGALMLIFALALDLTGLIAMVEAAGKIDPVAIQAMMAYWNNDWVPMALGVVAFHLGVAVSSLKHGGIPKWLGALSAVIVVVGVTPHWGFFAMPATAAWIVLASITLAIKALRTPDAPPPPMAA